MSDNLIFPFQTVFVLAENLDIVIHESQESQPYGGDNHQQQVDITHTTQEQDGNEDRHNDDDTSHRGNPFLLHAKGVDAYVTCRLGDISTFHPLDEPLSKPCGDDQGENQCQQGTERNVRPDMCTWYIVLF